MRQGGDIEGLAGAFRLKAPWYRSFRNNAVRGGRAAPDITPLHPAGEPTLQPVVIPAAPPCLPPSASPAPTLVPLPDAAAEPVAVPGLPVAADRFRLLRQALDPLPSGSPLLGLAVRTGASPPPAGPHSPAGRMRLIAAAFSPARPSPRPGADLARHQQ